MKFLRFGNHAVPAWLIAVVIVSTISGAVMAYVLSTSFTMTLQVKEPLSIVDYPSQFSLFPGETADFNVTVMNSAPLNYSVILDFNVTDSEYQTNYLSFSDQVYNVLPGQQTLAAWMSVATDAPAATVTMSVNLERLRSGGGGETPSSGLVGYWKFDEGSGTSAYDSSGNGNNGVLIGGPTWTAGKSGDALSFNGNNYVDCGNAASLHVQSYALAAWIEPSIVNDGYEHRIISNGGFGGGEVTGAVDLLIDVNGRLVIINQDGYGQDVCRSIPGSLFTAGTWSYVAVTYDATSRAVRLYVNGAEVGGTISTMRVPNPNPSWDMHIGVTGGPSDRYFKGTIDEVQIYNRALTPAEISSLYNK